MLRPLCTEWSELQTVSQTSPLLTLFLTVFLLDGLDWDNLASSQPDMCASLFALPPLPLPLCLLALDMCVSKCTVLSASTPLSACSQSDIICRKSAPPMRGTVR